MCTPIHILWTCANNHATFSLHTQHTSRWQIQGTILETADGAYPTRGVCQEEKNSSSRWQVVADSFCKKDLITLFCGKSDVILRMIYLATFTRHTINFLRKTIGNTTFRISSRERVSQCFTPNQKLFCRKRWWHLNSQLPSTFRWTETETENRDRQKDGQTGR